MTGARINPSAAELDVLAQGSIAVILDGPDDKWPEAFLRYGSGWTRLEAGTADNDIPSEGLLIRPEQTVLIVWDAAEADRGIRMGTEEELTALPEGTILRGVRHGSNPAWPKVLRRVRSYPGAEFIPSSPDLGRDPIPAGAAALYYGGLTVIWSPQ